MHLKLYHTFKCKSWTCWT